MKYNLVLDEAALSQLRALPKTVRRNIGRRLDLLQDSLQGDVRKLTGEQHRYRLRT